MKLFYYLYPGQGIPGSVRAANEAEARKKLAGGKRLPRNTQIWEVSEAEQEAMIRQRREMAAEMRALNVGAPDL